MPRRSHKVVNRVSEKSVWQAHARKGVDFHRSGFNKSGIHRSEWRITYVEPFHVATVARAKGTVRLRYRCEIFAGVSEGDPIWFRTSAWVCTCATVRLYLTHLHHLYIFEGIWKWRHVLVVNWIMHSIISSFVLGTLNSAVRFIESDMQS